MLIGRRRSRQTFDGRQMEPRRVDRTAHQREKVEHELASTLRKNADRALQFESEFISYENRVNLLVWVNLTIPVCVQQT